MRKPEHLATKLHNVYLINHTDLNITQDQEVTIKKQTNKKFTATPA